jgi:hypothetical protein
VTRPVLAAALVGAIGLVGVFADDDDANAQRFDPRRPSSWVVGPPPGESPMVRVDARRSGRSRSPLPAGPLKVAWRQPTANKTEQPALAGADGTVVVVADNGAVSLLEATGEPRGQQHGDGVALGGPPALTSDGTLVYVTSAGDAFGYQPATGKRWTRRIGAERSPNAAPLPLDDGGAVFASGTDLVVLDADGGVRARVTLPEKPAAPLLGAGDQIVVVTSMGNVYGWVPGREPVRLGSFGAPVDGAAALRDATTLVGVIDGNLLAEVDLVHGGFSTRALAPQGLYLGPPAVRGGFATMLALTPTRSFVVTVDAAGQELLRAPAGSFSQATLADGGAPPLTAPPHVGPIVDDRGAIAFATTDSHVGVVSPDGAVDILGDPLCPTGARGGVVGLTPAGPGRFLVTCEQGGVVLAVTSAGAAGSPAPSRP